jgi:hypothetical protein
MCIHDFPLIDVDAHYTEPADLWSCALRLRRASWRRAW